MGRDHALRVLTAHGDAASTLLPVLAGRLETSPVELTPQIAFRLAEPNTVHSLPALLERLCLRHSAISDAMRLPKLRHLEIQNDQQQAVELGAIEQATRDSGVLPPIEVLLVSSTSALRGLSSVALLSASLRELRLSDGRSAISYSRQPPAPEQPDPRWSDALASLKRLQVLALDGVQISPEDVSSLDQLPNLRALTLNRQKSLRVRDLAVLPRIAKLAELQLDDNPLLLLQTRDWMKDIGCSLPHESAATVAERKAEASIAMADIEEQKGGEAATDADAAPAAAVATSSVPALTVDAEGMLPLLSQCRSLRLLRWCSVQQQLIENERYTSPHSWVKVSASLQYSRELQDHRLAKEHARERQALRTLIAASPDLSIESGVRQYSYLPIIRRAILLPPRTGSLAEAAVEAAAKAAREIKLRYDYNKAVSQDALLCAFEDRALLAIETAEEAEWRADAEEKAAKGKSKPKRRNKY